MTYYSATGTVADVITGEVPVKTTFSEVAASLAAQKQKCDNTHGVWDLKTKKCIYPLSPAKLPPTMQIQSCPPSCPPGWSKEGYPPWHPSHPSQKKGITIPINTLLLGAVILLLLK